MLESRSIFITRIFIMKTLLFTLIILILLSTTALSQNHCDKWSLGMHYNFIQPLTHLHKNGYKINHGANVEVFYLGLGNSTIQIQPGLKLNLGTSSSNKASVLLQFPANAPATAHSHNMLLDFNASARFLYPTHYPWSVYADLNLGARHTWARETIKPDDNGDAFENAIINFHRETSTLYGVNLGLLVVLSDRVDFDIRANYESCVLMNHFDLNTTDYSKIESYNPSDLGIEVGIRIRIGCTNYYEDDKYYNSSNRDYCPTKTKVIKKRTNTIKI